VIDIDSAWEEGFVSVEEIYEYDKAKNGWLTTLTARIRSGSAGITTTRIAATSICELGIMILRSVDSSMKTLRGATRIKQVLDFLPKKQVDRL
jgi:hypothetical protein